MLINESNWKQELSMRKAMKVYTQHLIAKQQELYATGTATEEVERYKYVEGLNTRLKELDKAIETIENVFVHKRCYI